VNIFNLYIHHVCCCSPYFLLVVWLICSAYQNNDITEFEKILKTNRETIMEDPFIREHIEGELITAFTLSVPP